MPPGLDQPCRCITLALVTALAVAAGCLAAGAGDVHTAVASSRFAESWARHGFMLQVAEDGSALAEWRIYAVCTDEPAPPCDTVVGDEIIPGGRATIAFAGFRDGAGDTLHGSILISTDDAMLPAFGAISLTLLPYDMAELDTDARSILRCGPRFAELAPADV